MAGVKELLNLFNNRRENITEKLKSMGLNPLPGNIHNHEEIISHLNNLQSQLDIELNDLNILKNTTENNRKTLVTRSILNVRGRTLLNAVNCIEGNIVIVKKDMTDFKTVLDFYEQNQQIRDTSDLNESIVSDEGYLFSTFINSLLIVQKNNAGGYIKIRDFTCLKNSLREEWNDMQTHTSTANLVLNNNMFNTYEAINAILV